MHYCRLCCVHTANYLLCHYTHYTSCHWRLFQFWSTVAPLPPWLLAGTFMVARMLCRSLSWMGCVGLAAPAAREDTVGVEGVVAVGEAAEVAEGVIGVVGTWVELRRLAAEVEVGVTAVDGLKGEWYTVFIDIYRFLFAF